MEVVFLLYCSVSKRSASFWAHCPLTVESRRLVVECLVIFFYFVETKGPTLEEIAVLFDGEDSAAGFARMEAQDQVNKATVKHEA